MKLSDYFWFNERALRHLDYEAGEEQVGRGGDVDGGSVGILSLVLQSSKDHHPPPPGLHYEHRALWCPLMAAEWPGGPVPWAAELPSGKKQRQLTVLVDTW